MGVQFYGIACLGQMVDINQQLTTNVVQLLINLLLALLCKTFYKQISCNEKKSKTQYYDNKQIRQDKKSK